MLKMRGLAVRAVLVLLLAGVAVAHAASLSVAVSDRATGAPVVKAAVAVFANNAVVAAGRTSAEGKWSAQVADAAKAYLVVGKKLYVPVVRQVALSGQVSQSFALEKLGGDDFRRLGRIVGFVRNAEGQPLENATLVLLKGATPVGVTQPQNPTGVYELEWYAAGTYTVLGTAPGYAPRRYESQTIVAGESLWLDVELQPR
ncbi:MAG: carboxypeptidase-like regulatory domain-containing protein [Armatimonadota bacterium]